MRAPETPDAGGGFDLERTKEEIRAVARSAKPLPDFRALGRVPLPPSTSGPDFAELSRTWDVWASDPIPGHRPVLGPLVRFLKRVYLAIAAPFHRELLRRQRAFNAAVVESLTCLDALSGRVDQLSERLAEVGRELAALRFQPSEDPRSTAEPVREKVGAPAGKWFDHFYFRFENEHRGREEEIRRRQTGYLDLFAPCAALGPVLDLGCGRGEFLELLRGRDISGFGADMNAAMIETCREKGLTAEHGDGRSVLSGLADGSLGGLFAAQVIEHLAPEQLLDVASLAFRKLAPGGVVLLESVNPASVVALARLFWLDLSHVRPYHPDGVRTLLAYLGFRDVEVRWLSPIEPAGALESLPDAPGPEGTQATAALNRNIERLNTLLYGPLEYAVVARR